MRPFLPYGPRKLLDAPLPPDKKVRKKGQCAAEKCRRPAEKIRGKSYTQKYCSRCKSRRKRARNPCRQAYLDLKHRAKQRGHSFSLTLTQWETFWRRHNLAEFRGKGADALTVDRVKNHLGYEIGNLQVLPNHVNATKNNLVDWAPGMGQNDNEPF